MKQFLAIFTLALLSWCSASHAAEVADPLQILNFKMSATNPDATLDATVAKLRTLFLYYRPVFGADTTVISPLRVSGSEINPVLDLTVEKCVFGICKTVALHGLVGIRATRGNCARNYLLAVDLSHSSASLANEYRSLEVEVCYNSLGSRATIGLSAYAIRARGYSGGVVANQILDMLRLQVQPMSEAMVKALRANGGSI